MLTKNERLEKKVSEIPTRGDSLDNLVDKYLKIRRNPDRVYMSDTAGLVGELYVRSALRNMARENNGVRINPLPRGTARNGYEVVHRKRGSLRILREESGIKHRVCELDEVSIIYGDVAIVETHLSKRYRNRKTHEGRVLTEDLMQLNRLKRYEPVVNALFSRRRFCYVLVIYPERIREKLDTQKEFFENGGIVVPFPMGRKEYLAALRNVLRERKVKIMKDKKGKKAWNGNGKRERFAFDKRQNGIYNGNGNGH